MNHELKPTAGVGTVICWLLEAAAQAANGGLLHNAGQLTLAAQLLSEHLDNLPSSGKTIPVPCNTDQATAMVMLGEAWLQQHAPERLRLSLQQFEPPVVEYLDECETCGDVGSIDERLDGYSFSNPTAKCLE